MKQRDDLAPATMDRLQRDLAAIEQADPLTRTIILSELLGTSAYVVEVTQQTTKDEALNIVLATMEAKLAPPLMQR